MKRLIYFFAILSIALFACGIPTTTITPTEPPVVTDPPFVTGPPIYTEPVTTTETPVVTEPATAAVPTIQPPNVTCHELSLYLNPALATSYSCEIIPESTLEMEMYPQYTKITLQGYPLQDKFFPPSISVFPVQRYKELLPDYIPGLLAKLQSLTSGSLPGGSSLPFLPIFNAAQTFHAQYLLLPFLNGSGIRYLTLFAQYTAPINNNDLFYTYQGLTADGQYWVSAILPVNHPILPADAANPPGGLSWEQFSNNYSGYITDIITQLEAQPLNTYIPDMAALDTLVASITVQP
jgi:hypothetical protein